MSVGASYHAGTGVAGFVDGSIDDVRFFQFNPGEFDPATHLSYPEHKSLGK